MRKAAVPVVLVAVIAVPVVNILKTIRPWKPKLPVNDNSKCTLLDRPWGAEDLVLTKQGGWVIASSANRKHFIDHGIDSCQDAQDAGGLWTFRPDHLEDPVMRLTLYELPPGAEKPCFNTHGLFLSNATDRLYAVTHHGSFSSVEIFQVNYPGHPDEPPFLTWIRSVRSDKVPNGGLNDVVEGTSPNELYVTQFVPSFVSLPRRGIKNPDSWWEAVRAALLLPVVVLRLKYAIVLHCTFHANDPSIDANCEEATGGRVHFISANGITTTDDRSTVFVNDTTGYVITVFRRDAATGKLQKVDEISLEHACDNIEWKRGGSASTGELWMGTIPEMGLIFQNEAKELDERKAVPGGLTVVSQNRNGSWGPQHVVYNHDGTMLSQVSFGLMHNGKMVLGSAYAKGILVCEE